MSLTGTDDSDLGGHTLSTNRPPYNGHDHDKFKRDNRCKAGNYGQQRGSADGKHQLSGREAQRRGKGDGGGKPVDAANEVAFDGTGGERRGLPDYNIV